MAGLFGFCAGLAGTGFKVGSCAVTVEAMVQPSIMEQISSLRALALLRPCCLAEPCCRRAGLTVDLPGVARGY